MGLFQHKHTANKPLSEEALEAIGLMFDDEFREELRSHGRAYFERIINENAALFKQDLDATVAHINTELKQHVTRQLDQQFTEIHRVNNELREHIIRQLDERLIEYDESLRKAQDAALESIERRAERLEEQYRNLSSALEKSLAHQDALLTGSANDSRTQIDAMKRAQEVALKTLNESIEALQQQHEKLGQTLQESVAKQEDMLISAFENNMARVIEHYLLGAVSEQYDLKAQLPAIIQQMEANKQAMTDDMKL